VAPDGQVADVDEALALSQVDGLGPRVPSFRVRFGPLRPVAAGAPGGAFDGDAPPAPLRAGVAAPGAPGDVAGPARRARPDRPPTRRTAGHRSRQAALLGLLLPAVQTPAPSSPSSP